MISSRLPIIDVHQDLLVHINFREKYNQNHQTDFELLAQSNVKIVVATAFPEPPDGNYFNPVTTDLITADFAAYHAWCVLHPEWSIVKTACDIARIMETPGAHGLILHIEGLNVCDEKLWEQCEVWYTLGWRSCGIVWNLDNPLGGGAKGVGAPLTVLGEAMITWLVAHHMLVDCAHMSATTFWDTARIIQSVNQSLFISHGNCCALCDTPRNYTDDQLKKVAETDGVIGPFFAKTFVTGRELPGNVKNIVQHIEHMRRVMGIDHIALGTDFGGIISGTLDGLAAVTDMNNLWLELARCGYTDGELEKIAYKNAARVLAQQLTKI
jgi:membrane dipeptidase